MNNKMNDIQSIIAVSVLSVLPRLLLHSYECAIQEQEQLEKDQANALAANITLEHYLLIKHYPVLDNNKLEFNPISSEEMGILLEEDQIYNR